MTQELGEDNRFIIESTDLDKLLYVLIIYTCHMTNHQAPINPDFYKKRYGLRSKRGQIVASLRRLRDLYPKLSWGEKNLSLLNSTTYQNGKGLEKNKNKKEKESKSPSASSSKKSKPEKQTNELAKSEKWFAELWQEYPNRVGKKHAKRHFNATVKTEGEYARISEALRRYKQSKNVQEGFVKNGSTWFNEWEDWVDYKAPEGEKSAADRIRELAKGI